MLEVTLSHLKFQLAKGPLAVISRINSPTWDELSLQRSSLSVEGDSAAGREVAAPGSGVRRGPEISRRTFLRLAAGAGAAALAVDSVLLEPNHPQVVQKTILLERWPESMRGFRIAVLSDFHYDATFSEHPLRAAIPIVNDLRPDLVALTGDFVSLQIFHGDDEKAAHDAEPCADLLRQISAPHGIWAVLGNHDFFTDPRVVADALRGHGIGVLENQSVPIEANGGVFRLGGVNDVLSGTADLESTFRGQNPGEPAILLAHEPDYADYVARYDVDLQLSGHSHGGQVRLPFLPPLYLPAMGRKYVQGQFKIGGLTLYTNAGLGTVALPVRLNCPPEITLIRLEGPGA
jgi:predicted MPP superfamily phosphohydrolase